MENRQSIIEYFESLQIEYLITQIRRKIYTTASDKRHYDKVMNLKEEKINDIAIKNSLKTIFNSPEKKAELIAKVFPTKGLPQFGKYLRTQDITNYYSKGATVKVYSDMRADMEDFHLAKIQDYDISTKVVVLRYEADNSIQAVNSDLVTRLL